MIAAREYASASDIIAGRHAVRNRLWNPPNAVPEQPPLRLVEAPEASPEPPLAQHDDHVNTWRQHQWQAAGETPSDTLRRLCKERGLCYKQIVGVGRFRKMVVPRYALIADMHKQYPRLSLPQLGKIFHRDHTTILAALRKYGLRTAGSSVADHADEIKRLFDEGMSHQKIGEAIGYSNYPVGVYIRKQGWTRP